MSEVRIRSQVSGVRSEESGVRGQGSGVRGKCEISNPKSELEEVKSEIQKLINLPKRNSIDPIHPVCSKKIYYSEEEARQTLEHIRSTRHVRNIRVYRCISCRFWHLTSRES